MISDEKENGSAAFYIIMAIALLAALTFAVSSGSRSSNKSLTNDQARMAAQEILDYGNAVASSVQKLRLRGCTDTQINFESGELGMPNNPTAPGDDRCDVFGNTNGAQMMPRPAANFPDGLQINFSGQSSLRDVGTYGCGTSACTDLYFALRMKGDNALSICTKINEILNNTSLLPPPTTTFILATTNFSGAYGTHVAGGALFSRLNSGCYIFASDPTIKIFYQVLIAR